MLAGVCRRVPYLAGTEVGGLPCSCSAVRHSLSNARLRARPGAGPHAASPEHTALLVAAEVGEEAETASSACSRLPVNLILCFAKLNLAQSSLAGAGGSGRAGAGDVGNVTAMPSSGEKQIKALLKCCMAFLCPQGLLLPAGALCFSPNL